MNRRVGIAIIVTILVVAYPAAAWLIGLGAEHRWEQREQEVATRFPYFKIVKREYHRGVYGATEEATYCLTGPFARQFQSLPGRGAMPQPPAGGHP